MPCLSPGKLASINEAPGQGRKSQGRRSASWEQAARSAEKVSSERLGNLQGRCQLRRRRVTNLLVNVDEEMIKTVDPYQAEPRKFHVRNHVERHRQSARENHHMHPAARFCRGHSKARKERTTQPKAEQHDVDDIGWMLFDCAKTQPRDLECVRKCSQDQRAGGPIIGFWAGRDRLVRQLVFEVDELVLLLGRPEFFASPEHKIMRHAIQLDSSLGILLHLALEVAPTVTLEQAEAVICRADGVRLLNDQLSAFVKPLESTRNGECHEQADQREYGTLCGAEPRHAIGAFPPQVLQTKSSPVVQQDQRTDEEYRSDSDRK